MPFQGLIAPEKIVPKKTESGELEPQTAPKAPRLNMPEPIVADETAPEVAASPPTALARRQGLSDSLGMQADTVDIAGNPYCGGINRHVDPPQTPKVTARGAIETALLMQISQPKATGTETIPSAAVSVTVFGAEAAPKTTHESTTIPASEIDASGMLDGDSERDLLATMQLFLPEGGPLQVRLSGQKTIGSSAIHRQAVPLQQVPQMVARLVKTGEQRSELLLHPEELGRLRFAIQHQGDRLTVVLSAEQAGTLDLVRRNAGDLISELTAAGFAGATLSFGQWSENNEGFTAQGGPDLIEDPDEDARLHFPAKPYPPARTGLIGQTLDLKL